MAATACNTTRHFGGLAGILGYTAPFAITWQTVTFDYFIIYYFDYCLLS